MDPLLCLWQTVLDLFKQQGFKTVPEPMLAALQSVPALRLTIWEDQELMVPVQDIKKMALKDVAKLYSVSSHDTYISAC